MATPRLQAPAAAVPTTCREPVRLSRRLGIGGGRPAGPVYPHWFVAPYADILDYEPALTRIDAVHPYDHTPNAEGVGGFSENLFVGEYGLLEQVHNLPAWLDVFAVLYPQLQDIDLRTQARRLDVPVYLVQGRHEPPGRAGLAEEWFAQLEAPTKQMVVFDTAGHRSLFERPDLFNDVMTGTVLPRT